MYPCFRPLDYFVMWQNRSHPGSNKPFNCGDPFGLMFLFHDQFLRDIEQCLELLEVGVLGDEQFFS